MIVSLSGSEIEYEAYKKTQHVTQYYVFEKAKMYSNSGGISPCSHLLFEFIRSLISLWRNFDSCLQTECFNHHRA